MPIVLTAVDAAVLLGTSEATVQRRLRLGVLPGLTVGQAWRLWEQHLRAVAGGEPVVELPEFDALPEMLSVTETAQFLRVGDEVIRKAFAAGELPAIRIGTGKGQWRLDKHYLRAMFDEAFERALRTRNTAQENS